MTTEIPILTVTELTNAIKLNLENAFRFVVLQGEVSNCKLQSSGHLYFSLKDSESQIAAVMFRSDVLQLTRTPKDGDHVTIKGALQVYPPSGKYQIVARELKYEGVGELLLRLEQLKIKLHKMGWFRKEHKKPLPKFPKKIGVVTSPTGAVIQDIINVLNRRAPGFHLILNPVKVQGDGAAQEIAAAIDFFNRHEMVDVMIVGRGGGSIEDLWAFNEEIVAIAIFNSKIPIISAVGHETDHCIADYVADVRAPTPSAAAEIVIAEKTSQIQHLSQLRHRLQQCILHQWKHAKQQLHSILRQPIFTSPYTLLGPWMQKLDDARGHLDRDMIYRLGTYKLKLETSKRQLESLKPTTQIMHYRQKLNYWDKAIHSSFVNQINQKKHKLKHFVDLMSAIDPRNLLTKGYSILFSEKDGSVITSVRKMEEGESIRLLLSDGEAISTVKEIHPREHTRRT